MNNYPPSVCKMIELLCSFPGIGRRGAERMVLAMLKWPAQKTSDLADAISRMLKEISFCPDCGNISENGKKCSICRQGERDISTICVVEDFSQIASIENAFYKGLYHVLGGKLSPLRRQSAEDLNIEQLISRASAPEVKEVILSLSSDVEGRATGVYLCSRLHDCNVKISAPARGIPVSGDITYADGATIAAALKGRTDF